MTRVIIFLVSGMLLLASGAKSNELKPLNEYLKTNNKKDLTVSIYLMNRCAGLSAFIASFTKEKAPDLSANMEARAKNLLVLSATADSKSSKRKYEDSIKNFTEVLKTTRDSYLIDGKKNWAKTGSYFENSYIDEDRKICEEVSTSLQIK
jgi:hypothetical protein